MPLSGSHIMFYDRAESGTMHLGIVCCASWGKDLAGTVLPSVEHYWLKCSRSTPFHCHVCISHSFPLMQ